MPVYLKATGNLDQVSMTHPLAEDGHTLLVSTAAMLDPALRTYGLDLGEVLADIGVDPGAYSNPSGRVPTPVMRRVWVRAVELTGDPCFGLTLSAVLQPVALHGLGLSMLSSDTLKSAIVRAVRYHRIVSTILRIELSTVGQSYRVAISSRSRYAPPVPASVDATMAILLQMLRLTASSPVSPTQAWFEHTAPDCHQRFDDFFGCRVKFCQEQNLMIFDRATLDRELPSFHPELARANDRVVIDYLDSFERQSLEMRVRQQIIDDLPNGTPSECDVAAQLCMSLRNLQRQLKAKGSSYQRILDETRKALAIRYLEDNKRQLVEISYLLGYSEQSNFNRAFKRWTGTSPHRHRQQVQQPAAPGLS